MPSSEPGFYLIKLATNPSKGLADPWDSTEDGIKLEVNTCSDTVAFRSWVVAYDGDKVDFVNANDMAFGNKDGVERTATR